MGAMTYSQIEREALQLPEGERAELATLLLDSLEPDVSPEEAAAIEAEWLALAEQRLLELESDPSIAIPLDEVMAESRKLLR